MNYNITRAEFCDICNKYDEEDEATRPDSEETR
jgi:hypothetical protein